MIEILKAIIFGIIQGITEFLPISSSGHLSVAQYFFKYENGNGLLFTVLLHMGTLLAVLAVYYKTILALVLEAGFMLKDILTGKFKWREMRPTRRMLCMLILSCLPLLLLLLPIGGDRRLMDALGSLSQDNDIFLEGFCFLFTATLLLFGTKKTKQSKRQMDEKSALAVGFAQFFAAGFPGISRSGSTIASGMYCGIPKEYMVRYSFILGIPAILAANVVELKDAVAAKDAVQWLPILLGTVTAAIVGFIAIKVLEWLVKRDKFRFFGYYCLVMGCLVLIAGLAVKLLS